MPREMKVLNPYRWKWARHQQLIFKNFSLSFMLYEAQIETADQSRIVSILDGSIFEQEAIIFSSSEVVSLFSSCDFAKNLPAILVCRALLDSQKK